jgi:predicted nuclease of predicted toxin-antitoxin system
VKFKLDENFGTRGVTKLSSFGHDVATVLSQGLCSAPDAQLIEICRSEQRCLVTMDLDFANPIQYPPRQYAGIAVLRLPARSGLIEIDQALETLGTTLGSEGLEGKLWIVERDRIREYADESAFE